MHGGIPQLTTISRRRFLKTGRLLRRRRRRACPATALPSRPAIASSVTRYHVSPPQLDAAACNLSIGVIADVHAGGPLMPAERIRAIAERTNALKPDVIVLLGDFAASHKLKTAHRRAGGMGGGARASSGRRSACTPFSAITTGGTTSHAQRTGEGPVLGRRVLERVGIPVYENDAVRLDKDGRPFWLAGLGDQLAFITRPAQARLAPVRGRRRSARHARQGHRRCARRSCSRTSPTSSRACPSACRSRCRATRTAARCACSAIRRWCRRATATASPTATSSKTTAT